MTPVPRRTAALRAMSDPGLSPRRACGLIGVDPKTVRRDPEPDNPEIRQRMCAIASAPGRSGYRRIRLRFEPDGIVMNHKKRRRRYREEGLSVRRRRGRRRATGVHQPGHGGLADPDRGA